MNFNKAQHLFYHVNRRTLTADQQNNLRDAILSEANNHHNNGSALMLAGRLYYEGFTVTQDFSCARDYFIRADAAGNDWGSVYLAYCYYYGRDIPKDHEKAYHLFKKAAKHGNHCALYKLGDMYRDGLFVQKNSTKALDYYQKAFALVTPDVPEHPNIAARIGHMLLLKNNTADAALDALHYLNTAEEGCYHFLLKGDPYAHLSLPQIASDQKIAKDRLTTVATDLHPKVFYQ